MTDNNNNIITSKYDLEVFYAEAEYQKLHADQLALNYADLESWRKDNFGLELHELDPKNDYTKKLKRLQAEGLAYKDIMEELSSGSICAKRLLIKEPSRQSIGERFVYSLLKLNFGKRVKKGNRYYLTENGAIVNKKSLGKGKSIDFIIDNRFYINQKWTNDPGGHQDNVINEIKGFMQQANKNEDDIIFIAMLNGLYWTEQRLEELEAYTSNKVAFKPYQEVMELLAV